MATKMENVVAKLDNELPFRCFYKHNPLFLNHLHIFGEIGMANHAQKLQSKLANHSKHCMFVKYANDHAGDTFKMLNLKTKQIWKSCNVKWIAASLQHLDKLLQKHDQQLDLMDNDHDKVLEYVKNTGINQILDDKDKDNNVAANDGADEEEEVEEEEEDDNDTASVVHPMSNKTFNAMKKLATFYNPIATNYIQDTISNNDTIATSHQLGREDAEGPKDDSDMSSKTHDLEEDCLPSCEELTSATIDYLLNFAFYTRNQVLTPATNELHTLDFKEAFEQHTLEPTTFGEAYHEDPEQQAKWQAAIKKEFRDMTNCGVWGKVKHLTIPKGCWCIKSKWAFRIKRDGIFCARLVAFGYCQIPGVDFTKNYAPVMNDMTWHILLVAMIVWGLDAIIVDMETTFLHGDLEEEIYMNLPDRMEGEGDPYSRHCTGLCKELDSGGRSSLVY